MKPIIVADRDGTLIYEKNYLKDPRKVKLLKGAVQGLKRLKTAGYRVVVLSNQAGVGRGIMTLSQAAAVQKRFRQLLKKSGAKIDGYYFCPHRPDAGCACRKPKLRLLKQAAKAFRMPWKGTISVGDRKTDVQVGQKAGGLGVLVLTGYGRRWAKDKSTRSDYKARNFNTAVSWILRTQKRKPS